MTERFARVFVESFNICTIDTSWFFGGFSTWLAAKFCQGNAADVFAQLFSLQRQKKKWRHTELPDKRMLHKKCYEFWFP